MFFNKELTPEQRLHKAIVTIMSNPKCCPLVGVLMIGKRDIVEDFPTAATNGRDEVYGVEFVKELSDPELRFVVIHETYHKLYRHLHVWSHLYEIDEELAGQALDYVINLKIMDEFKDDPNNFIKFPTGKHEGLLDERFRGMDSAQVFNLLRQDKKNGKGKGKAGGGGNGKGFDKHDWANAKQMTPQEARELTQEIDAAVRQGLLASKKSGDASTLGLEELTAAKIPWRDKLREFVLTVCKGNDYSTWSRPNRKYIGEGIYMPSGISEEIDEIVIAVDTSGSIGQRELRAGMSEVVGLCAVIKPRKIHLIYWDTRVAGHEIYGDQHVPVDQLLASTKPVGGGGTHLPCVTDYLAEHGIRPNVAVIFTDGYVGGDWGNWNCATIWGIIGNKSCKAPVGESFDLDEDE
jgi:predicted metal-dependent peptidase